MDIKRIFGTILTGLGIIALIYAAILFVNTNSGGVRDVKVLITYSVLGLIFFVSGIGLVKMTGSN
ncbi:MAG TPA: hypothetical protein VHM20_06560 [Gammaproteobacteria bacterium]|jgi:uncharacterized membrane protein|nr:hypothetical protein [Gammaproteobacteria bacterium]HVD99865.1 hypothetical protein [Cytophagaceae bacterium]